MRLLLAAAFAFTLLLALPGKAQNTGALVRIFALTQGVATVDAGIDGASAGDQEFRGLLLADREGGIIGYGSSTCISMGRVLPSSRSFCQNVYVLPKGTIVASGLRARRDYYLFAVVGGTGIYSSYDGTLIASTVSLGPRRERLLFSLEP